MKLLLFTLLILLSCNNNYYSKKVIKSYLSNKILYFEIINYLKINDIDKKGFNRILIKYNGKFFHSYVYLDSNKNYSTRIKYSETIEDKAIDFMYNFNLTSIIIMHDKYIFNHQYGTRIYEIICYNQLGNFKNNELIDSNSTFIIKDY